MSEAQIEGINEVEHYGTVKSAADKIYSLLEKEDGEPSVEPEEPVKDAAHPEPEAQSEPKQQQAEEQVEEEVEAAPEPTEDESEPVTHFNELADHLNVEEDFLLGLEIPTKVNGEERSATIKDLIAHYQKGESADLKLMDLAENRKKMESEQSQINEKLQQEWGQIQALRSEYEALLTGNSEQDLEVLRHSDPAEYAARRADLQYQREKANELRQKTEQFNNQKTLENYARNVEIEKAKLPVVIPEWSDEKTAKEEMTGVRKFLLERGFHDYEIDGRMNGDKIEHYGLVDSRLVALARDAYLYRQAKQTSEPKKTRLKSLPKVGSGKRKSKGEVKQEQYEEIRGRVRKTGTTKDAAKAIEQMMMRGN